MYTVSTCVAGATKEVQKTFTRRWGHGIKRNNRTNSTPDAMHKYNEKLAMRELTRLVNANFLPKDMHIVLTYAKDKRPLNATAAKNEIKKFIRKCRKIYKANGLTFKYIYVTAIGERGGIHHHIIMSSIDIRLIRSLWTNGGMHSTYLYENKEYSHLAEYFVGQIKENITGDGFIMAKRWVPSKNLIRPEMTPKEVDYKTWHEPITAERGYIIDIESIDAGTNPVTNIPYLFYRMIKQKPQRHFMTPDGRLLKPDAAERWLRKQNAQEIKQRWSEICTEGNIVIE